MYALRWESAKTGKKGWSPSVVGGWANAKKPGRAYLPINEEVVESHLAGESHLGLFPLRRGDECRLLVCDFDGTGWVLDALAYLDAAAAIGVPVALERSRSGEGAHTWTFFSGPIPAATARRLGVHILRQAMEVRAELDFSSHDRLFPTQDFVPKGSFGNLIAFPLQGACRRQGNTVFLDPASLEPYEDQWAFLASIPRMSPEAVDALEKSLAPVVAGPDDTRYRRPIGGAQQKPPEVIRAVSGAMLAIDRIGVPPALVAALKHLASLHNPEHYEKERLRFSTWSTPRFLRRYGETSISSYSHGNCGPGRPHGQRRRKQSEAGGAVGWKTRKMGLGVAVCPVALTALSSAVSAQTVTPLPSASRTSAALSAWSNFPVHASPRPLVLIDSDNVNRPALGFPSDDTKAAYDDGDITAPSSFHTGPRAAAGFPLVSSQSAFSTLKDAAISGPPATAPLVVTSVTLGTSVFQTDRGQRTLPAWLFSFQGVQYPARGLGRLTKPHLYAPQSHSPRCSNREFSPRW